jgi:hypothetical protein
MNVLIQINVNASDNAAADQLSDLLDVLRGAGVQGADMTASTTDNAADAPKPSRGRGRPAKNKDDAAATPTVVDQGVTVPVAGTTDVAASGQSAETAPVQADAPAAIAANATAPAPVDAGNLRDQVKAMVKQKQAEGMTQDALVDIMKRETGVAFLKQVPEEKLQAFLDALRGAGGAEEDAFG